MAVKVTVNTANKVIKVKTSITDIDVQVDLYSDLKEDWLSDANLRKLQFPFIVVGGNAIGGGQVAPTYYFLRYPWVVETSGDGVNHSFALNLYALAENGVDTRYPFVLAYGDGVTNNTSNIPGLSSSFNQTLIEIKEAAEFAAIKP